MNAVIYARFSSHGQNERSIEGQLQDCYAYAERCGYTVVGEYIDKAYTGTNDARPDFQKMLNDAAKKQFQYVIVWKLDRFARNRYDSAIYKRKLKKYGVRVISAMENITDTPEGIMLESMLEGMAEYYSANLSQNVKRGMRVAIQNKGFLGGAVPYGFKVVDKTVTIDEKTGPIARWIFEQYASGMGKKEIIDCLNAKGYKTNAGKSFNYNSLQHTFSNKKYIGIHEFDGEEIEGIYPPLIDVELFNRAQVQLEKNRRAPAAAKAKVRYVLQGKIFCGLCGAHMVGDCGVNAQKVTYYYYACNNRKKKLTDCKKMREKKDFIEWYVVEQTILYVLAPERIEMIAERIVAAYNKDFDDSAVKNMEKRIKQLDSEIDRQIDLALNTKSETVRQKVDTKVDELAAEKAECEIELTKLKIANKAKLTKEDVLKWLKSFCKGDLFDLDFRQKIIDAFINSVYLFDDKVIIYYNIKDSKQVSYIDMLSDLEETTEENEKEDCSDKQSSKNVGICNPMACRNTLNPNIYRFINRRFFIVLKK